MSEQITNKCQIFGPKKCAHINADRREGLESVKILISVTRRPAKCELMEVKIVNDVSWHRVSITPSLPWNGVGGAGKLDCSVISGNFQGNFGELQGQSKIILSTSVDGILKLFDISGSVRNRSGSNLGTSWTTFGKFVWSKTPPNKKLIC